MRKRNELTFGTGCIESKLDGTEHIFTVDDKIEIPREFSWKDTMPPVRNQGLSTTCVC